MLTLPPNVPAIVFTDWDGTITTKDSNDYLTDNFGFGMEKRAQMNRDVLENKINYRDSFSQMLQSVKKPFQECVDEICQMDPYFETFYEWCKSKNIPVIILSSGMEPIIRAQLKAYISKRVAEEIVVISNQVDIGDDGSWEIKYRDDSHYGHDKSTAIKAFASLPDDSRPKLFYIGDGVSDLSAARETDLLFTKQKSILVDYCVQQNLKYVEFEVQAALNKIIDEQVTLDEVYASGKDFAIMSIAKTE